MGMSTPYEATGRTRQKARTRGALIDAARELMSDGVMPTVERAAERAEISKTTAYRYFPNQRELILATWPDLEAPSLLGPDAPSEPAERLAIALDHLLAQVLEREGELRAQLWLSLDPANTEYLPFRQGRAIGWYEDALSPLRDRMSEAELRRLAQAIRAASGVEAFVWLTDIAGLSREEAVETMRWSAHALLDSATRQLS